MSKQIPKTNYLHLHHPLDSCMMYGRNESQEKILLQPFELDEDRSQHGLYGP